MLRDACCVMLGAARSPTSAQLPHLCMVRSTHAPLTLRPHPHPLAFLGLSQDNRRGTLLQAGADRSTSAAEAHWFVLVALMARTVQLYSAMR